MPHNLKFNTHASRAEHSNDNDNHYHEVLGTHGYSDVDVEHRFNRVSGYKLPIDLKHSEGRCLPPDPVTTSKKLPTQSQQRPGVTPLTDFDSTSGSSDLEMSSQASADQTNMSGSAEQSGLSSNCNDDASSYAPSSTETVAPVPTATAKGRRTVARPPLHPRTFTKHDPNTVQQQTSMPWAPRGATKPSKDELQVLQVLCLWPICYQPLCAFCCVAHVSTRLSATLS